MKYLPLILILLFPKIINAQSKPETEKWILEKYNEYRTEEKYDDDIMGIKEGYLSDTMAYLDVRVKIDAIKSFAFTLKNYDNPYIEFRINFDPGKLEYKADDSTFKISKNKNDVYLTFRLKKEFFDDGMKEKMEQAFLHLINLHGGNAVIN